MNNSRCIVAMKPPCTCSNFGMARSALSNDSRHKDIKNNPNILYLELKMIFIIILSPKSTIRSIYLDIGSSFPHRRQVLYDVLCDGFTRSFLPIQIVANHPEFPDSCQLCCFSRTLTAQKKSNVHFLQIALFLALPIALFFQYRHHLRRIMLFDVLYVLCVQH